MNLSIRPLTTVEVKYTYSQSHEISMRTELIGYLRMDFGSSGEEFYTTWWDVRSDLNTPKFKKEFDEVINSFRKIGEFLFDLGTMEAFCDTDNVLHYPTDNRYCGVRVDTDKYAYLMRLYPYKGDYNMYCYCFIKDWLDGHIERAKHGISICDASTGYNEICRLDDGDEIVILNSDDSYDTRNGLRDQPEKRVCRYINDTHFECGNNLYHVDQFAEILDLHGWKVIPLRASLPDNAYVYVESVNKIGIVTKGESGYRPTDLTFRSKADALDIVDTKNQKLGITKAQAEAMKCGSMFGWHTRAADPKIYDEKDGHLVKRNGGRS